MAKGSTGSLAYMADDGHIFNSIDPYLERYVYIVGSGYHFYRGADYDKYVDMVAKCVREDAEYHTGTLTLNYNARYEF